MESSFCMLPLTELTELLASRAPVPGGGGAAALAGVLASSLASMVCALTTGKKRYAAYEGDIQRIAGEAEALRRELLGGIDRDASAFEPLSKAYSIPKDAPERAEVMENALRAASKPPMDIAESCGKVLELLFELSEKGSAIAVSDVGVGAQLAKAALLAALLNVRINIKSMADRDYAGRLRERMDALEARYISMAEETYEKVLVRIG